MTAVVKQDPDERCDSIHPATVARCTKHPSHVDGELWDRTHTAQGCVWASHERRGR